MAPDHVDRILEQWARERPDVDVSAMAIIARLARLERMIRPRLNAVFAEHGLESWEFDVLATLRRSGPPYRLTAGQLLESLMITSGAVTNRIDRLAERGLVCRKADPNDGRVVIVCLEEAGRKKVDAALVDHAANELRIVGALTKTERKELAGLLRRLHESLSSVSGKR